MTRALSTWWRGHPPGVARPAGFAAALLGRHAVRSGAAGVEMVQRLPGIPPVAPGPRGRTRILSPVHIRLALAFSWHESAGADGGGPGHDPLRSLVERVAGRARRIEPVGPIPRARRDARAPLDGDGPDTRPTAPRLPLSEVPGGDRLRFDPPALVHRRLAERGAPDANVAADDGAVRIADTGPIARRLESATRRWAGRAPAASAVDVERVATEVLTVIDRRLAAHRERAGRI